jgi:hypothetical protein
MASRKHHHFDTPGVKERIGGVKVRSGAELG